MTTYFNQFFPLQVASLGLVLLQAYYRSKVTVVATSFHLMTVVFTTMIQILAPAWTDVVLLPQEEILFYINPLGMASYVSFFLGTVLTFGSIAVSNSFYTADLVCGVIIFVLTSLVFFLYSGYYVYTRQNKNKKAPKLPSEP